jgi:hypothetical protein
LITPFLFETSLIRFSAALTSAVNGVGLLCHCFMSLLFFTPRGLLVSDGAGSNRSLIIFMPIEATRPTLRYIDSPVSVLECIVSL